MCKCGHSRNEHLGGGARQCTECDCSGYDPEPKDDEVTDA